MNGGADGSGLVFVRTPAEPVGGPPLEIIVNFGLFVGRTATLAETDRLARLYLDLVEAITIVSEERHEISLRSEASVHQIRIEITRDHLPEEATSYGVLEQRLVERADHWARGCLADRSYMTADS